jgi:hypothetical protein
MFKSPSSLPWYYVTRTLGAAMVVYGLVIDHSPERGTIILGGLGLLGYDSVKRSEPSEKPKDERKE